MNSIKPLQYIKSPPNEYAAKLESFWVASQPGFSNGVGGDCIERRPTKVFVQKPGLPKQGPAQVGIKLPPPIVFVD